jgi:replicative DNA helicase
MSFEEIYASLSDEDKEKYEEYAVIADPVRWAETTLRNPRDPSKHLIFRDYQKKMLTQQPVLKTGEDGKKFLSKRMKVYRLGRRCGKTVALAVEALWHAFTKSNTRVLMVTPFESQVREIFANMERIMHGTFIKPTRSVKKPFILEFGNGSRIIGYTAGATSSVKGSGIRGQSADVIILDEMDHGIDDILKEVIMPIWVNNQDCIMITSSTPSGRHGLFWEICKNLATWDAEEFHVPSSRIPGWNSRSEELARKSAKTQSRYEHEYMAEFGTLEEGVFQNKHILHALTDYKEKYGKLCGELPYNDKHKYFMGVDWNEIYGVTISILEKRPGYKKARLWKKDLVERSDYTQPEAVSRIIDYSKKINFEAIYVDRGFGGAQEQWLKKYGAETINSNLDKVLKGINYGGKVQIRDPINNKIIEKPAKPFMVDNCVYFLENELFELPIEEDEAENLVGAMRGYKIKRFSARTNDPVYECEEEDHELDALFLALLAITIETTDINQARPHARFKQVVNSFRPKDIDRDADVTRVDEGTSRFHSLLYSIAPNFQGPGANNYKRKPTRKTFEKPKRSNI